MSLTFCNARTESEVAEWDYNMRLDGSRLVVTPDPFGGRTFAIEVAARMLNSEEPVIVRGVVSGS